VKGLIRSFQDCRHRILEGIGASRIHRKRNECLFGWRGPPGIGGIRESIGRIWKRSGDLTIELKQALDEGLPLLCLGQSTLNPQHLASQTLDIESKSRRPGLKIPRTWILFGKHMSTLR
jgi:hypothetical protein